MNKCSHCVCFQVKCNCSEQQPTCVHENNYINPLEGIYSKFASTLEQQLKTQHQKYSAQLDDLNNELFTSKNTITRLELRNKKDLQALNDLRRQYNLLLQKLKNQEGKVVREVETVQRIKQVPVHVTRPDLEEQISYWKKKSQENGALLAKVKMEKGLLQQQNMNLKEQFPKYAKAIKRLEIELQQLNNIITDKDRLLDKSHLQIELLKKNKEIIIETKHLFPDFKSNEKTRTQTKIETVYVEKPVEKIVFVDVEKIIKQFVEPERAVVNRVISCGPTNCKCDDEETHNAQYQTEIIHLQSCVNQLEENINAYRSERAHLVDIIGNKNSELNYMESKMRLFGANKADHANKGPSTVNVTVSRVRKPETILSPKGSIKTMNNLNKK